jgi:hypothetical protein
MIVLEKEFNFFIAKQDELLKQYKGKFIVIKNCKVIGSYDDILNAIEKTSKHEQMGTFLVQKCEPGVESYTQMYHSRVRFA